MNKPVALVTGVSRSIGIGAAIVTALESDGWDVASAGSPAYDQRMPWGADEAPLNRSSIDLADPAEPARLVRRVGNDLRPITALVLCHAESVDSDLRTTTVESFDRHMAVNARATWLLIRAYADQFPGPNGAGRIVGITSDHTAFNLPYGASKGAMDRIVLAAAVELSDLGVTANVVNPGPTDTGWIEGELRDAILSRNFQPRIGTPTDCANLVRFLCSTDGGWVNHQLIHSNGGRL